MHKFIIFSIYTQLYDIVLMKKSVSFKLIKSHYNDQLTFMTYLYIYELIYI